MMAEFAQFSAVKSSHEDQKRIVLFRIRIPIQMGFPISDEVMVPNSVRDDIRP